MEPLKTNIQELVTKFHTPFDDEKLTIYNEQYSSSRCFLPDTISKNTTVDINKIVGHAQCYPVMNWKDMLTGLKGINKNCKELVEKPYYYNSNEVKKCWSFFEIEGNYFILDGKHRTTVFKYFSYFNPDFFHDGAVIKGVRVTHKHINYELEHNINRIKQILLKNRFKHIRFGVTKSQYEFPAKYYLANMNRSIGYHFFNENELSKVCELLQEDSKATRLFGKNLGEFLRESSIFPW